MIKERVLELKKDLAYIRKYLKFSIFFVMIAGSLAAYNQYYFNVERDIIQLSKKKNQLIAENMMLKKEASRLSSPERIEKIAKRKLKMKPVDFSKVRFIDTK